MLRFISHDDQHSERPVKAVLMDKDDLVIPGVVECDAGQIVCQRSGDGAMALSILHDTGEPGCMALRTCLLQQREAPYRLTVELARHRIAMFVFKAEEWAMTDLAADHPAMKAWDQARQLFTRAMVTTDDAKAERAGCESLSLAINASERLATAHAEILIKRRFHSKPAPSTAIGVRVSPSHSGHTLQEIAKRHFRLIAIPLRWDKLCPQPGEYHWGPADKWIAWAEDHGCKVLAGPLVDLGRHGLPGWVASQAVSYEQLRDLAYDHVEQVVSRYGDHIGMWSIGTGIHTNRTLRLRPADMLDLVRTLALRIRQGHRGRRVILELDELWGDYLYECGSGVSPTAFVEQVVQAGVRLDAVGLRLQFGDSGAGRSVRDLMEISRLLDRYVTIDPPVLVTDIGVPAQPLEDAAGWWRTPWSEDVQGQWATRVMAIALSKPHISSVIWTDLYDHHDTQPPTAGMLDDQGNARQVIKNVVGLRRRLSKPFGEVETA